MVVTVVLQSKAKIEDRHMPWSMLKLIRWFAGTEDAVPVGSDCVLGACNGQIEPPARTAWHYVTKVTSLQFQTQGL